MKITSYLACAFAILSLSGCATVLRDETQPLKIETKDKNGNAVTGARCVLESAAGTRSATTPRQTFVRRDASDLHITCTKDGYEPAQARVISSASGAMVANVLLGVVWALVDHADGQGYSYPEWIEITFGEISTFTGAHRETGKPAVPAEVRPLPTQISQKN